MEQSHLLKNVADIGAMHTCRDLLKWQVGKTPTTFFILSFV
jgi:hypothetical protein